MINGKRIRRAVAQTAVVAIVFTIFAFRAAEWTSGIDSEFIVFGQTGVTLPPPPPPPPPPTVVTAVTKIIPQIAVGTFDENVSKFKTVIQVVNEGSTAATVSGNFYNEDGTASTLVLKTNLSTLPTVTGSFASVSLPTNGILVITADTAAPFAVNWGKIVSTGGTVSASAYFDLTSGDGRVLLSRAGVAASEPGLAKFTIPRVRSVEAGLDMGFALVNTGATAATIDATLRSEAGAVLGTKSLRLAAGGHTAAFAKDFFALTGEVPGTNYSFMTFESGSAQFAATALAIEGGSLSGFPVSVPGSTGSATEISDGSVTTVKLVNAAVTADKIADGAVVKSINSLKDAVTLAAGTNVTITPSGNTLTIAAGTVGTGSAGLVLPFTSSAALTTGAAFAVTNTGAGGTGIEGKSTGTILGLSVGVKGTGSGTAGIGVSGTGSGTGSGVDGTGGASFGAGVRGTGTGTAGIGVSGTGSGTGSGVVGTGGGSSGVGVYGTGGGTAGVGVYGQGLSTGAGVKGVGGGAGLAGEFIGGITVSRRTATDSLQVATTTTTGSLQVGTSGTAFSRIQAGAADLGRIATTFRGPVVNFSTPSIPAVTTANFTITFPQAFSTAPKIIATPRVTGAAFSSPSFVATTVSVSATQFVVNVRQVDDHNYTTFGLEEAGNLGLDWMAWE